MRNYEIWKTDIDIENWIDFLEEEFPEKSREELLYDSECYYAAARQNDSYLDVERANLNIPMGEEIIAIADLGFWHGRRNGYRMIESGNIADCLRSFVESDSSILIYLDARGDLRMDESHHDGVNHYLFRVMRHGRSAERLQKKILDGEADRAVINGYTKRLGDAIADVYGWKIYRGRKEA